MEFLRRRFKDVKASYLRCSRVIGQSQVRVPNRQNLVSRLQPAILSDKSSLVDLVNVHSGLENKEAIHNKNSALLLGVHVKIPKAHHQRVSPANDGKAQFLRGASKEFNDGFDTSQDRCRCVVGGESLGEGR